MDESELQSIPLFESLPRDARSVIAQHADEIDVDEGTDLVRQGEFAYEFFVIEEGGADVLRDGERIAGLGPGDFLGEMGIVSQAVRNATVRTTASGTVMVMTSQDFRAMQRSNPTVASQIEAAVEERCRALG
jgi:CRP/FNR family transcriptional regulator, cyclic AMP receptor protein